MKAYLIYLTLFFSFLFNTSSCLRRNDLDYPLVLASINSFSVEGQKSVHIDAQNKTISIVLNENADISKLKIIDFNYTNEARIDRELYVGQEIDLSNPMDLTLSTYQNYSWKIAATQPIERYLTCENQLGEASFDIKNKSVLVRVSDSQSLSAIVFKKIKLEAEGSILMTTTGWDMQGGVLVENTRELTEDITLNCIQERKFLVRHKGKNCEWKIKVVQVAVENEITEIDAWAKHAKVKATFRGDPAAIKLEYKKSSESIWKSASEVNIVGVGLSAEVGNLDEDTSYDLRLANADKYSQIKSFVTEKASQVENMNFDSWNQDVGYWSPNSSGKNTWDTANGGTKLMNIYPTVCENDILAISGNGKKAAKLTSELITGKLSSGSLYTGVFGELIMAKVGVKMKWGIPFNSRPKSLKGHYSYIPKQINKADKAHQSLMGELDNAQIRVVLTDWDEPFEVISYEKKFLDPSDPKIIAFGELIIKENSGGYKAFEIPLEYRFASKKPKYLVIVAASSRYGDYFTGAVGSVLYVDEFAFTYE